MKNRSLLFVASLLFCVSFLQSVQAQSKAITADEYNDARQAGQVKAEKTYPRIETYTYTSSEPRDVWSRTVDQSERRSYEQLKLTFGGHTELTENVYYDGERFQRIDKGIWKRPSNGGIGSGNGRGAGEITFTVEQLIVAGKQIRLYARTETFDGNSKYTNTFKIDAAGRMLEYEEKEDDHRRMIYEYPKTVPPIKKPILGSKKDI